jgi:hypothetical protein
MGMRIDTATRSARRAAPAARETSATIPGIVEIHIDEVVLWNFSPGDRSRIADALEAQLGNLLMTHGLPDVNRPTSIERLDAGSFKVAPGEKPQMIGGQVAKAVYRQLSPLGRGRPNNLKTKSQRRGS